MAITVCQMVQDGLQYCHGTVAPLEHACHVTCRGVSQNHVIVTIAFTRQLAALHSRSLPTIHGWAA
jgi:hypothetical protein